MTTRKYRSEFALNVYGDFALLIQQADLVTLDNSSGFNEENPCHIYMICRRPRITYDPGAFRLGQQEIAGQFRVQIGEGFASFPFALENSQDNPRLDVECPYPHTKAIFRDQAGGATSIRAADLAGINHALLSPALLDHLALEVLYVGQSYGVEGAQTAPGRLRSHSTLQGIYAEAIANSPDMDIWLLLWSLKSQWVACIDGRAKETAVSEADDDKHIREVLGHVVSDQLEINLAEAALIRYFQPEYNKIYKNSFPNPAHSTYADCYSLDLNTINVEVSTEDLGSRLMSARVPPHWTHLATYPLHSAEERRAMFDFS